MLQLQTWVAKCDVEIHLQIHLRDHLIDDTNHAALYEKLLLLERLTFQSTWVVCENFQDVNAIVNKIIQILHK